MGSIIGGGTDSAGVRGNTPNYVPMFFGNDSGTEGNVQSIMPVACTVRNLHARFRVGFSESGNPAPESTITIRKNGSSSVGVPFDVTCTIVGPNNSCSDTITNGVSFGVRDLISVEVSNNTGLGNVGGFTWTATCN
jgi:hypothetical protein